SALPCSVRSTSRQPVNRFCRFHSLWPWRTSTRVLDMFAPWSSCPVGLAHDVARKSLQLFGIMPNVSGEAEHVPHRIEAGLLAARPQRRLDGAPGEDGA